MNNERPLTCVRCGTLIPSGYECSKCLAPQAAFFPVEPTEPERSDAPRLVLSAVVLVLVVIGMFFGFRSISAAKANERYSVQTDLKTRLTSINNDLHERQREQAVARIRAQDAAQEQQANSAPVYIPPTSAPSPPASNWGSAPFQSSEPMAPVDTTVTCSRCGGTGMITILCSQCEGKGEIVCGHCTSLVQMSQEPDPNCTECGGTSHRGLGWQHFMALYRCPKCHGTKRITEVCPDCHGSGKIDAAHPPETSNLEP